MAYPGPPSEDRKFSSNDEQASVHNLQPFFGDQQNHYVHQNLSPGNHKPSSDLAYDKNVSVKDQKLHVVNQQPSTDDPPPPAYEEVWSAHTNKPYAFDEKLSDYSQQRYSDVHQLSAAVPKLCPDVQLTSANHKKPSSDDLKPLRLSPSDLKLPSGNQQSPAYDQPGGFGYPSSNSRWPSPYLKQPYVPMDEYPPTVVQPAGQGFYPGQRPKPTQTRRDTDCNCWDCCEATCHCLLCILYCLDCIFTILR